MSDVDLPTSRDLMYPTLAAVQQLGGSAAIAEFEELVPEIAGLSSDQLAVEFPPGTRKQGRSKVVDRIDWARTFLKQIGALNNTHRGVWSMTSKGMDYLSMDAEAGDRAVRSAYAALKSSAAKAKAQPDDDSDDQTESDEDDWKVTLLETMKTMDPYAFERLAMLLLRVAGFRNVEVTKKSGDGGIDGIGVYKMSLVSFPTYFQCKRYAGSVAAGEVRDFRGAMTGRGEKGLIITTGTFTPAARRKLRRLVGGWVGESLVVTGLTVDNVP